MKIDLSIITKSINKELTQEADISLTSFRSRLGDFPIVRKAPVTLQIRNEENAAVFVKGTVDIDVMIPCARCLEEVRTPIRFDIDKKLTVQEEGRVVVSITVNPAGHVIATSINRLTNTVNSTLRKAAEDAAKKARFNAVDGVNNQTGTITYYFNLK